MTYCYITWFPVLFLLSWSSQLLLAFYICANFHLLLGSFSPSKPFLAIYTDTYVLTSLNLWMFTSHFIWKNYMYFFISSCIQNQNASLHSWHQLICGLLKNLFQSFFLKKSFTNQCFKHSVCIITIRRPVNTMFFSP